jgi:lipoprotein-releasing system ATP-binding protein
MNGETCLSCEGIERYLGEEEERVHALRGVSLDIDAGSIHAVVGPSGCGKSSLLYVLGLLDLPDAGRVSIQSEPVSQLSDDELAHKRNKFIGFIFQFHFLMEDFTAQENVMIPIRKLGQLSDSEMRDRAAHLLEVVGLGDKLRRPSRHLSGGEQQRVAIARALANDPKIILADEPTGNLDTKSSHDVMGVFDRLNAAGRTVVVITHEEDVAAHAKRAIRVSDGQITDDRRLMPPGDLPPLLQEERA